MDDENFKKSLGDVFSNAMRSSMRELDLWDLAQLPKKRREMTPQLISKYRETVTDFLEEKIDEEKCVRRLRALTGLNAHETYSLITKLKKKQVFALKSK
ncbi:hypothetical protein N9Y91_02620 [Alphaproteobacteria bacterium]|nr:hypothetical protein [Alphaproteobacteria bacterium]